MSQYWEIVTDEIDRSTGIENIIGGSGGTSGGVDYNTLMRILQDYVRKEEGKGLSSNDFTDEDSEKLDSIEANAQENTIESISVNNVRVNPNPQKNVNISVPTKVSQLTNDSGYAKLLSKSSCANYADSYVGKAKIALVNENNTSLTCLDTTMSNLNTEVQNRKNADGTLSQLKTENKSNLVSAINELYDDISGGGSSSLLEMIEQEIEDRQEADTDLQNQIDDIDDLIPEQASSENQLADKNFVNSSIQTTTANFRGNWTNWADVPTNANDYPADYVGNKKPTVNDYMVVQDASDYTSEILEGTWRFKYTGDWDTDGKSGWQPEYQVNETPLTAQQLASLNSGITCELVAKITDVYDSSITVCQGNTCIGSFTLNGNYPNGCILCLNDSGVTGIDVFCDDTCKCKIDDSCALCLSQNAFNQYATIDTTQYVGACCTGTLVDSDLHNCTITLCQNTTCIGSFTLNQSSACVITLTDCKVKYNASDLNNDVNLALAPYGIQNGNICGINYSCGCPITYNSCTGLLKVTSVCADNFCGSIANAICFSGCTYACACKDFRNGLTGCIGTVTNIKLNGCAFTICLTNGCACLDVAPSVDYCSTTRKLCIQLGCKSSNEVELPNGIDCVGTVTSIKLGTSSCSPDANGVITLPAYPPDLSNCAGLNCTGTLVPSDLNGYATETWVTNQNYCTHDCLVKLSLLCSNIDRRILFSAQENGCICPVYASNGVSFTYNACCGCLRIGDFSCDCCNQVYIRCNCGLVRSGPKGSQNNLGVVFLENNCLDNCSLGFGVGSGNVNRGIFDYCKASETATSPTFRWLQYWDSEKEIHNLPIWGELGANNKTMYSCVGTSPSNTRRYALICFDTTNCGSTSSVSACFEIDIYTSKYFIWKDGTTLRTWWCNTGLSNTSTAYGSYCAGKTADDTSTTNCFWITYSNYRAPVIKSARKISIVCNTTTAPTGVTFTAPTNMNVLCAVCLYNRPSSTEASKVCNVYFYTGCTNASCSPTNFSACICGANGWMYGLTGIFAPYVRANSPGSTASKVCNVVINSYCTNASCALTTSTFTFCGSTGYMHGNVCGNLCGLASCSICSILPACRSMCNGTTSNWYKIRLNDTSASHNCNFMVAFTVNVMASYQNYGIRISGYKYYGNTIANAWYNLKAEIIYSSTNTATTPVYLTSKDVLYGYDTVDETISGSTVAINYPWIAIQMCNYYGVAITDITNAHLESPNPSNQFTTSLVTCASLSTNPSTCQGKVTACYTAGYSCNSCNTFKTSFTADADRPVMITCPTISAYTIQGYSTVCCFTFNPVNGNLKSTKNTIGDGCATIQYNSTTQAIDFVFN